jgi:hypothetical protein
MNIRIDIERLVLDGIQLAAGHKAQLQAALETELARLLARGGVSTELRSGGAVPSLRANSIQLSGEGSPARLGKQIARAVYGGIGESGKA